jgi:hypothetical protein
MHAEPCNKLVPTHRALQRNYARSRSIDAPLREDVHRLLISSNSNTVQKHKSTILKLPRTPTAISILTIPSWFSFCKPALLAFYINRATMGTPTQVVSTIKQLTQKAHALQKPAQSISLVNGPLIVIGQGPFPQIQAGLADMVSVANAFIPGMQNMPPVATDSDAGTIFDAYSEVSFLPSKFLELSPDGSAVRPNQPGASQYFDRQGWIVFSDANGRRTSRPTASLD